MNITQADYKPLKDNIVVKVPELKRKTESGIHIPDGVLEQRAKERGVNMFIEVVAVGPDTKKVKVGMYVLSIKPPMELPNVDCDDDTFKLGFFPEYTIEGYYEI